MLETGWVYRDIRNGDKAIVIVCPCSFADILISPSKAVEKAEDIRFCPKCGRPVEFSPF